MPVFPIDPLLDPRWASFLDRHPRASVFHTPAWLEALKRTYGFQPIALTNAPPGQPLTSAMVFCQVSSWLTGRRSVSLPFSDHCDPLLESDEDLDTLLSAAGAMLDSRGARYLEFRPISLPSAPPSGLQSAASFCLHHLNLRPGLDSLFHHLHKNCIQRKVKRAQLEGLSYEEGSSEPLLRCFYRLLTMTRKRQSLPPQPFDWFRNLVDAFGPALKIRIASKQGRPVASILTLRFKKTMTYKYGGSDKPLSRLGGMPFLLWHVMKEAVSEDLDTLDLGRSDWDNPGLLKFKDRLGAARSTITYWRVSPGQRSRLPSPWRDSLARQVLGHLPASFLPLAGRLIYRHLHSVAGSRQASSDDFADGMQSNALLEVK